ncbi:hypothetical protein AHAS_Ahas20G0026000 [Arachis hypogaea]
MGSDDDADHIESVTCNETINKQENMKQLFQMCMEGRWKEVVEIYKIDKRVHTATMTRGGDSALHLAVTDGQEEVVSQLVDLILEDERSKGEALRMQNKRENTALHLAASVGTISMVRVIADADPELVSFRNVDGETPLFLAAFHGRKEAFMILHYMLHKEPGTPINYSNCRRSSGDTILHSTIAAENFELALIIIHLYEDLGNWKNEVGATPLHILASNSSVFKSGSRFGLIEKLIYQGITVRKLEVDESDYLPPYETIDNGKTKYPKNYQSCMDFMKLMKNRVSSGQEAEAWSLPSLFPANYKCFADFLKLVFMIMLVLVFGKGTSTLEVVLEKKKKHIWSVQIMNELLKRFSMYEYDNIQVTTDPWIDQLIDQDQRIYDDDERKGEAVIITAAKNGVTEMVDKILEMFPTAIHELDSEGKNIVLLAIENRHIHLYQLLLKRNMVKDSLLAKLDYGGNTALHLAAKLGAPGYTDLSRRNPIAALQMHWEIKWYKVTNSYSTCFFPKHVVYNADDDVMQFILRSGPPRFFRRYNKKRQTPAAIFTKTHQELAWVGCEWLQITSGSCSLLASLIATVAFATSTTVPGGVGDGEDAGIPNFIDRTAYKVFSISSLIALGSSINSLVLFLSILASRCHPSDFEKSLPRKLILGLISMFLSIISMLASFCAAHFLGTSSKLRNIAAPIYALACLPLAYFALSHFPLYIKLFWSTIHDEPQDTFDYAPL